MRSSPRQVTVDPALGLGSPPPCVARAAGLVKVYGEGATAVRALDGVDVEIPAGQFTAIMGPSGSGKSTLLHCLAGLDNPTSGQVVLDGLDLTHLGDDALTRVRRERVGFVFQAFNLMPTMNARQNILLPLHLAGRRPDPDWARYVLDILGLADRLEHRPAELSGGQQQRVAIARALLPRPALVVADEPTGNLDSRSGAEVLSLLRSCVREARQSVVMVTHDPNAAAYADTVILLADGRVQRHLTASSADAILSALRSDGGR